MVPPTPAPKAPENILKAKSSCAKGTEENFTPNNARGGGGGGLLLRLSAVLIHPCPPPPPPSTPPPFLSSNTSLGGGGGGQRGMCVFQRLAKRVHPGSGARAEEGQLFRSISGPFHSTPLTFTFTC